MRVNYGYFRYNKIVATISKKRNTRGGVTTRQNSSVAVVQTVAHPTVIEGEVSPVSQAHVVDPYFEAFDRADVPEPERRQFDKYVATGMRPGEAAFYAGIGSGRITGDADIDFSLIDPAYKSAPLVQ